MSIERTDVVKFQGSPLTLLGPELKVGDKAPDFQSMEGFGQMVNLSNFADKVKIFNVIISVDTPVCDIQTKRFNQEAANMSDQVEYNYC